MTLFVMKYIPEKRHPYWSAWTDGPERINATGRTEAEAIGMVIRQLAERSPDEVEIRLQETADFRKGKGGAA